LRISCAQKFALFFDTVTNGLGYLSRDKSFFTWLVFSVVRKQSPGEVLDALSLFGGTIPAFAADSDMGVWVLCI
jgi:hypothetical protein